MNKMYTEHEGRFHVCNLYWNKCTVMLQYILVYLHNSFYIFLYRVLIPSYEQEAHRY
jgi:hypothetical protein